MLVFHKEVMYSITCKQTSLQTLLMLHSTSVNLGMAEVAASSPVSYDDLCGTGNQTNPWKVLHAHRQKVPTACKFLYAAYNHHVFQQVLISVLFAHYFVLSVLANIFCFCANRHWSHEAYGRQHSWHYMKIVSLWSVDASHEIRWKQNCLWKWSCRNTYPNPCFALPSHHMSQLLITSQDVVHGNSSVPWHFEHCPPWSQLIKHCRQ